MIRQDAFERAYAFHEEYTRAPSPDTLPHLRRAIMLYEALLHRLTEKTHSYIWAKTQHNLASAYLDLPIGNRAENLARTIVCSEAALRIYTEADFAMDWTKTQNIKAIAYCNLPTGDRTKNLQRAIASFEAAMRVCTEVNFPANWAPIQNNLAAAYSMLPTGNRTENLQRAISYYEAALRVYTEANFPANWAGTQNNLAVAYSNLPTGDRIANLQRTIACYEAALRVRTEADFPEDWAQTQNNLGTAYSMLPTGNRTENLQRAIACYEAALRVRTEVDFPEDWAMIQNNLAGAYLMLPTGNRTENLQRAIACYEAALRVYTEANFPANWAGTQNNLAAAYSMLPTGDRAENLQRTIACYEAALRVRTEADFPEDWAQTQTNLANAYRDWPAGGGSENLKRAIACYEAALRVRTEVDFPEDWARTQNNLAIVYLMFPTGDHSENLRRAIVHNKEALRIFTEANFPANWAQTQDNLAAAYLGLPTGNRTENLLHSIAGYEAALRIHTETAFPTDWALAQHNLATAYSMLTTEDRTENLHRAIAYYEAALRVRTEVDFPVDRVQTLGNLGLLYFGQGDWEKALITDLRAISTTEQIREVALTKEECQRVFAAASTVWERSILAAIRTEQYDLALTLTERGKARNLADQLWQRELRPQGLSQGQWQTYQRLLLTVQQAERDFSPENHSLKHPDENGKKPVKERLDQLRTLRKQIAACEAQFAETDPDYLPFAPPMELAEVASIAEATEAVLVIFRVTDEGSYLFLLGPGESELGPKQVLKIPGFDTTALRRFLVEEDESFGGWLIQYQHFRNGELSDFEWLSCVAKMTEMLYTQLLAPLHERLKTRYANARRLIFIPNKGLTLLPLHAACWQEKGETHTLIDAYDTTYAPSLQVLKRALARDKHHRPAGLFAVQNPDGSLPFSDWEVTEVAKHFEHTDRSILEGLHATEEAVKKSLSFGEEKLFSTHGLFDGSDVVLSCLTLYDGKLSLEDIIQLDLKGTSLVVMSACETGLTDHQDVLDEYLGLSAAFLVAGAATIVPSLWAVDDCSTALLMKRFHENVYKHGMDKSEALRAAQRWLRNLEIAELEKMFEGDVRLKIAARALCAKRSSAGDGSESESYLDYMAKQAQDGKPFANPYWWAAFQCVGAGWRISK